LDCSFSLSGKRGKKNLKFVFPVGWIGVRVHMQAPALVSRTWVTMMSNVTAVLSVFSPSNCSALLDLHLTKPHQFTPRTTVSNVTLLAGKAMQTNFLCMAGFSSIRMNVLVW